MRIDDEALGDMMRDVAAGWPSDRFVRELRSRRQAKRRVWKTGFVVAAVAALVGGFSWSIASSTVRPEHPHGQVRVAAHQCDAGDDLASSFRAAVEAEALGDTQCAVRNFARVVTLAQPEHAKCSVADHPVDAQVAIARWELAHVAAPK
jgi:hypothetical protein